VEYIFALFFSLQSYAHTHTDRERGIPSNKIIKRIRRLAVSANRKTNKSKHAARDQFNITLARAQHVSPIYKLLCGEYHQFRRRAHNDNCSWHFLSLFNARILMWHMHVVWMFDSLWCESERTRSFKNASVKVEMIYHYFMLITKDSYSKHACIKWIEAQKSTRAGSSEFD
jgi:hypothetical protein